MAVSLSLPISVCVLLCVCACQLTEGIIYHSGDCHILGLFFHFNIRRTAFHCTVNRNSRTPQAIFSLSISLFNNIFLFSFILIFIINIKKTSSYCARCHFCAQRKMLLFLYLYPKYCAVVVVVNFTETFYFFWGGR